MLSSWQLASRGDNLFSRFVVNKTQYLPEWEKDFEYACRALSVIVFNSKQFAAKRSLNTGRDRWICDKISPRRQIQKGCPSRIWWAVRPGSRKEWYRIALKCTPVGQICCVCRDNYSRVTRSFRGYKQVISSFLPLNIIEHCFYHLLLEFSFSFWQSTSRNERAW